MLYNNLSRNKKQGIVRDRPFNLKGGGGGGGGGRGYGFFVSFRKKIPGQLKILFFFVAQSAKFFSRT